LRKQALTAYPESLHASSPSIFGQIFNVLEAIGFYIGKIFVPVHLDAYIPNIPHPFLNGVLGTAAIALVGVWSRRPWSGASGRSPS